MSEKICARCNQPIKQGEGYAETDIGTGKWVHWPSCPPSARLVPEKHEALASVDGTPIVDGLAFTGGTVIVDGLTWKDYYSLRDLRLLLWGLEKELVGKYGLVEAEPLASKVRELIKKKVEQVSSKIGSSPEHYSSSKHNKIASVRETLKVEQIAILDEKQFLKDIQDIAKKFDPDKSIIENLRQQGFFAIRFSTTQANYDPTHLNWYVVVDKANGLIMIVESESSSTPEHHSSENPLKRHELTLEQMWNAWDFSTRKSMLLSSKEYPYADIDITVKKGWKELSDGERKAIQTAWKVLPEGSNSEEERTIAQKRVDYARVLASKECIGMPAGEERNKCMREAFKRAYESLLEREEEKHHSGSEHHISREEAEAEIDVLIDNLAEVARKGGVIPEYLRRALRENFMFLFLKSNPHSPIAIGKFDVKYIDSATGKTVEKTIPAKEQFDLYKQQREGKISIISIHPSASTGNPDEKLERCVICGYEGTKEPDQHGNYIFYWQNEPICMVCREDYSLELDAGIKPSHIKEKRGKSE